ncbi:MAG: 3-hydroxyacyl-CoA dehydrogenase/enoyl-CoA hydratase family protein [Burkholderiaceae bacterium]|nr:3-hydroxyacyl-CoA dehydrogenase/enoyl-CoA hydratase family protein [Burkholderiaceae bacterium]
MKQLAIKKVAVLGAGVMGAQIAAHCINARVPVLLYDLADEKSPDRNGIVLRAIENLTRLNPAPLALKEDAQYIEPANYEQHLARLAECDLIIEAIAERMDWKRELYRNIGPHVAPGAILASNTSGLSINALSEPLEAALRPRFCGVHFFNPPRYMHLVELIPTASTAPEVVDQLETFLASTLGKGVVRAKDTPNFIANRVGVFGMLATIHEAAKFGLPYDVVDDLTGTRLGRAKSATFRTADVVGLDTMAHVIRTMQEALPPSRDPFAQLYAVAPVLQTLISKGALGQKSGAGFYRKDGPVIKVLDPRTADYVESRGKADELIVRILKNDDPAQRLKMLRETDHPQARFLWSIFRDMFHYAAVHLGGIAQTARDVDFALRWGFGWETGPFENWQAAGWQRVAEWVAQDIERGEALCKAPLPDWVLKGTVAKAGGVHTAQGSWNPARSSFEPRIDLPVYARQLFRAPLRGESTDADSGGATVFADDSCRVWRLQQPYAGEVLIFSIRTKMHVLGPGVLAGLMRALDLAEGEGRPLVIWSPAEPFSAGADLKSMLPVFMSGGPKAIGAEEAKMQQVFMRVKYAQVPVVAAVHGMALGGGCELLLHCARRVAALESYIGLVEVGVGLIPGAGGLKEGALRAGNAARAAGATDLLPFLRSWFQNAATATVSRSALEARTMGYLADSDTIVFNPYELLWTAVGEAFAMHAVGYRPPLRVRGFPVAGRSGAATIRSQLVNMKEGGFISEHDFLIAGSIADVMTGGEVDAGTLVDEQWLLDLERKHFVKLVAHPKSQERMMGMMQTGKPVRN